MILIVHPHSDARRPLAGALGAPAIMWAEYVGGRRCGRINMVEEVMVEDDVLVSPFIRL